MHLFLIVAVVLAACCCSSAHSSSASRGDGDESSWTCTTTEPKRGVPTANSPVRWWQGVCTGKTRYGDVGPIRVNTAEAKLANPSVIAVPAKSRSASGLGPLTQIMKQDKLGDKLVAGVNGGYFYRIDERHFFDDVCFGKSASDARKPVNVSQPIDGVGDCLQIRDGAVESTNCGCFGYNRPSVLVLNGSNTHIVVQHAHDPPPAGAINAIAAGPNLVSVALNGSTFVDIPKDDENVNRLGKSANTAVGFRRNDSTLTLVTFDGTDGCSIFNASCGVNVWPMATFMKDYLKVTQAMGMDQGGSTTMIVKGEGKDGVVSCSHEPDCRGVASERALFNGLFLGCNGCG